MKDDLESVFCWGGFIEGIFISNNGGQATFYDVELPFL